MTAALVSLLLAQSAPQPDAFGRGLLMHLAGWCSPAESSPLNLRSVDTVSAANGGRQLRWRSIPVDGCAPRGNPFGFLAQALHAARIEDGPVGAEVALPPDGDWGRAAFASATGQPFPERKPPAYVATYTPGLIRATFDAFYRRPGQSIDGISAQLVYDVAVRKSVRQEVDAWLAFLKATTPAQRKALARAYAAAALKADFSYYDYLKGLHEKATKAPSEDGYRVAGVVLRRTQDGTLATVLKLLVQVLDDYDPGYAKSVRGPLLAAAR